MPVTSTVAFQLTEKSLCISASFLYSLASLFSTAFMNAWNAPSCRCAFIKSWILRFIPLTFTRSWDRRSHHAPPRILSLRVCCIENAGCNNAGWLLTNAAKVSTSTSSVSCRLFNSLICLNKFNAIWFFA